MFTTDTIASEVRGIPIDFVNAGVGYMSEPPAARTAKSWPAIADLARLRQLAAQRLHDTASGAQGINRLIGAGDAKASRAGYRTGPTMPGADRRQHLRRRVDLRFQVRGLVTKGDRSPLPSLLSPVPCPLSPVT
jgi:hypothetical protein